jgi:PKD repeat protein
MRRTRVVVLAGILLASCSKSPTAPSPPPTAPATGTAVAIVISPNSFDLPAGGGSLELVIATTGNETGSVIAANVPVTLSASSGELSNTEPRTDSTGHARVTWTGTRSATVTARAGDVVGVSTIRVPGSQPPTPTPNPTPNPNPSPTPTPTPGPAALTVDIFPSPRGGDASTPISFNQRVVSTDGGPVGALTYAWDFGDGSTSTAATPTHLFAARDTWTVTLRVTAADGRTGEGAIDLSIGSSPAPLVAVTVTASPSTALVGATFTFTASATTNSTSGPVVAYDWDRGVNGGIDSTTTAPTSSISYSSPGPRTIRVIARTANGTTGTATTTITVNDKPIVVDLIQSGTPTVGSTMTFTATVTSPTGGTVPASMIFAWDYGNGSETVSGGATKSVTHTYNAAGKYDVKVTVTAPDGRTATKTLTVTIS